MFSFLSACGSDIALNEVEEAVVSGEPAPGVAVDSFVQNSSPHIDLLWVVDTSCSMINAGRQMNIGTAAVAIIDEFEASDTIESWSVGFISADNGDPDFHGPYFDYDSQIGLVRTTASNLFASEAENGLLAALTFLDGDVQFARDSASLWILFASDADDQSSVTVDEFYDNLMLRRPLGNVDVTSVVGLDTSSCYTESVGDKFIELSSRFSKSASDICSVDDEVLPETTELVDVRRSVELSEVPIEGSMVAYHNGDAMAPDAWTYEPQTRSVELSFVPAFGDLVEVGYAYELPAE